MTEDVYERLWSTIQHFETSECIADCALEVADKTGVSVCQMRSPVRVREVAHARQYAMYLARQRTSKSLLQIGSFFGGRDHTTVIHSIRAVERRMRAAERAAQ